MPTLEHCFGASKAETARRVNPTFIQSLGTEAWLDHAFELLSTGRIQLCWISWRRQQERWLRIVPGTARGTQQDNRPPAVRVSSHPHRAAKDASSITFLAD